MRVDKTDLAETVVEDGEEELCPKPDIRSATTKSRGYDNTDKVFLPYSHEVTGNSKLQQKSEVVMMTKQRVPVEDSEDDECHKETLGNDVECLTSCMRGCNIHETTSLCIEKQLAELVVNDEGEETRASLQSQSSVITVDPPSLPFEKEDDNSGEFTEDLAARGPPGGKATSYNPSGVNFNHISSTSYSSHNLDIFHSQLTPLPALLSQTFQPSPAAQMNGGMVPVYNSLTMNRSMVANNSSKRGMEDDEDNPYKYTRPEEEINFITPQPSLKDLNTGPKKPLSISQISHKFGCGGQVLDNSPEILSPSTDASRSAFKIEAQLSISEVDSMLEVLNAHDQQPHQQQYNSFVKLQHPTLSQQIPVQPGLMSQHFPSEFEFGQLTQRESIVPKNDYDPGYFSENSPPSEISVSPGSSPKASHSPVRPPSNMSHDSGIASPASSGVPSPPEVQNNRTWFSEDSVNSQFSFTDQCPSDMYVGNEPLPASTVHSTDEFFALHEADLLDALVVVANDIKSTQKKKVPDQTNVQKISNNPPSHNIPISVTQQKITHPQKLPIPPLVKTGGSQQQPVSVMKNPVPVMMMQPMANATPITSSQPVILVPPGQTPPMIVVVNSPQPLPPQQIKKQPRHIMPKPGVPISVAAAANPVKKSDSPLPKLEPSASQNGKSTGSDGVCIIPSVQANSQSIAGKKNPQNGTPQPSKMLHIARRLVASMTPEDLKFQDAEGDTYLHVSVCKADGNMVQALLERLIRGNLQSMINMQNNMRQTPLYLAVSSNIPEMVDLLIQYGADVNICAEHTMADGKSTEHKAALHCAASNGDKYLRTLLALLAARDLKTDLENSDGHTALHCAILEHGKPSPEGGHINNLPIIQTLIKHGADPNKAGKKSGKTALMYALESHDITLVENIVALIDPAHLRTYLKTQAFDGSTCLRILENIQRGLDCNSRQRLHACLKISGRKDNSAS